MIAAPVGVYCRIWLDLSGGHDDAPDPRINTVLRFLTKQIN
jgi:hypothetical protein